MSVWRVLSLLQSKLFGSRSVNDNEIANFAVKGIRLCRMHGLLPPRPSQTSRSPPPSFHYTVRSASGVSRVRDGSLRHAQRSNISRPIKNETTMSYIETFDAELTAKLESTTESTEEIVRWVTMPPLPAIIPHTNERSKWPRLCRECPAWRPRGDCAGCGRRAHPARNRPLAAVSAWRCP